ncbi:unknown [Clostridium sp. CAG:242]|nr:unknown [Clostridium sp. CAG:242]
MEITLQKRTADHVRIYFERTQDDLILYLSKKLR